MYPHIYFGGNITPWLQVVADFLKERGGIDDKENEWGKKRNIAINREKMIK